MWFSTSKGKTVHEPSVDQIIGALVAAAPDEAIVLARDLQRFVHAARITADVFVLCVRDGSHERQVSLPLLRAREAVEALVAFATDASFATRMVDGAR